MNVTSCGERYYDDFATLRLRKNKPNSKPIMVSPQNISGGGKNKANLRLPKRIQTLFGQRIMEINPPCGPGKTKPNKPNCEALPAPKGVEIGGRSGRNLVAPCRCKNSADSNRRQKPALDFRRGRSHPAHGRDAALILCPNSDGFGMHPAPATTLQQEDQNAQAKSR